MIFVLSLMYRNRMCISLERKRKIRLSKSYAIETLLTGLISEMKNNIFVGEWFKNLTFNLIFNMSGHLHTIRSTLVYNRAPSYGITPSLRCRTNALRSNAVIRRPCSRLRYTTFVAPCATNIHAHRSGL